MLLQRREPGTRPAARRRGTRRPTRRAAATRDAAAPRAEAVVAEQPRVAVHGAGDGGDGCCGRV